MKEEDTSKQKKQSESWRCQFMHRVSCLHMHDIQIERETRDGSKTYVRKMLICIWGVCGCDSQVRSTRLKKNIGIRSDGLPQRKVRGNPKKVSKQLCGEVILWETSKQISMARYSNLHHPPCERRTWTNTEKILADCRAAVISASGEITASWPASKLSLDIGRSNKEKGTDYTLFHLRKKSFVTITKKAKPKSGDKVTERRAAKNMTPNPFQHFCHWSTEIRPQRGNIKTQSP